ncbi:hypothetical protein IV203_023917 [Nitzschia inconspicua]|uniref:Uncharacterized protein n=1 Tax=Nitzschia inconspicua TaxID=303405 RepID=A0A9K3KBQ4_9STRA|nr:hypothetical protein IV203_023917 [Nitzschia inconspicua]
MVITKRRSSGVRLQHLWIRSGTESIRGVWLCMQLGSTDSAKIECVAETIHSAIEFAAALDLDRRPRLSRTNVGVENKKQSYTWTIFCRDTDATSLENWLGTYERIITSPPPNRRSLSTNKDRTSTQSETDDCTTTTYAKSDNSSHKRIFPSQQNHIPHSNFGDNQHHSENNLYIKQPDHHKSKRQTNTQTHKYAHSLLTCLPLQPD